jgi:hypothetical protein
MLDSGGYEKQEPVAEGRFSVAWHPVVEGERIWTPGL